MISATEERIKTNKLLMDICNFNKDLFDTSTLSPEEIRYYNKITDGFNNQIQSYIDWLDSDEAKRIFQDYTRYNDQVFKEIEEYTQDIIQDTKLTSDEIIDKLYDTGLTNGYKEIRRTKYYNDATKYGLKFLQYYNFSLISNLNDDLKKHIRTQIFNGIVAGESMPEVAQKILHAHETSLTGKTLSARQRAMMIARTETARAMTQGRLQSYANYGVQEVKILTAGDSSVCAICREAEAKIFPISEAAKLVPFHPLCRCSVMAYIRHGILQGKPDEDAQGINLTPFSFNNHSDEVSSEDFIVLTSDKIPNNLPKILQESMLEFDKHIQNVIWEYGYIGNLTANNYGEFVTDKNPRKVHLRTSKKVSPLDKLVASHSHLGYMPFNNDDFEAALSNINCQFMIVHTSNCVYIAEFESTAFANVDRIIKEVSKSYGEGLIRGKNHYEKETGNNVWENYKNNKVLNKYMRLVRIEK